MDKESGGRRGGRGPSDRPIVKKIIKKGGHAHHGGSWKVAYADFVTAMMAFFLLMWLLGAADEETRAGIASYFQRPLKEVFTRGDYGGGDQLVAQSAGSDEMTPLSPGDAYEALRAEAIQMDRVQEVLAEVIMRDSVLQAVSDQLKIEMTPEGMRIQLVDKEQRSMFARGSAMLEPFARKLLLAMTPVLDSLKNPIILTGHTDAMPYGGSDRGYSNWELSVDRANAARRALVEGGLEEARLLRVEGLAATVLARPEDPQDAANRRISLLLLNDRTAASYRKAHTYH
jgi:chemotaxis protein MotB